MLWISGYDVDEVILGYISLPSTLVILPTIK